MADILRAASAWAWTVTSTAPPIKAERVRIVFQITPSGTFTELYDFTNTTDGAYPKTPPVQAQDGNLYGTTNNGTIPSSTR